MISYTAPHGFYPNVRHTAVTKDVLPIELLFELLRLFQPSHPLIKTPMLARRF